MGAGCWTMVAECRAMITGCRPLVDGRTSQLKRWCVHVSAMSLLSSVLGEGWGGTFPKGSGEWGGGRENKLVMFAAGHAAKHMGLNHDFLPVVRLLVEGRKKPG